MHGRELGVIVACPVLVHVALAGSFETQEGTVGILSRTALHTVPLVYLHGCLVSVCACTQSVPTCTQSQGERHAAVGCECVRGIAALDDR